VTLPPSPPPGGRPTSWLALDIGGANLKAADGTGWSHSEPFALWREWQRLSTVIAGIVSRRPAQRLAGTMTGEIADCFATRGEGVRHIITSCVEAATGQPLCFYSLTGRLITADDAIADPLRVAAANWHALARLAGRLVPAGRGLLVDIGSTTTDLVPLLDGQPAARFWTDWDRLAGGELLYLGVERAPVPAVVRSLPHRGVRRPVAAEWFATVRDAWLTLGRLPERAEDCDTADGGPATREAARIRLARTMLLDPADFDPGDAAAAAGRIAAVERRRLAAAISRHLPAGVAGFPVVVSGHGQFLAEEVLTGLGCRVEAISLSDQLGPAVSRVGPAHALALIARGLL